MSDITETFEELKSEAKDLGLDIKALKSKKNVKAAIDAHYANQAADGLVEAVEEADEEVDGLVDGQEETDEDIQLPESEPESEVKTPAKKTADKNTGATKSGADMTYKEVLALKPDFSGMSKQSAKVKSLKYHALLKQYWMGKRIVTITNNDKRDNAHTTMAFLSAGVMQRQVPLDIPVEIERCLIKVAQELTITAHVDEVINGKRTGNKMPIVIKKYGVSLQDNEL